MREGETQRWVSWAARVALVLPLGLDASVARAHITEPDDGLHLDPGPPPLREPDPEAPPDLFPRVPVARAAGWFFPPEPLPAHGEEEAEARLDEFFDDALSDDRMQVGQVDGWYYEVGRQMRQEFRPNQGAIEAERRAGMTVLQLLNDEFRRYRNGPEQPMGGPGQTLAEQRAAVGDPTDRAAAAEQELFDWYNPLNAPVTWYRVDIRVTHNPEGELSASWVLRSSGLRTLDQAALDAARSGGVHQPEVPEAVVGDRQAVRSDWAFEFGDVATYWNTAGCVMDDQHGETQCAVLGRGIVRTRVRLLRVVDATHLTPAEQRAARHRDPDRARP